MQTHKHTAHSFFQIILTGYNLSINNVGASSFLWKIFFNLFGMETRGIQEKDTDGKYQYFWKPNHLQIITFNILNLPFPLYGGGRF